MIVTGLITEYNPFHFGHELHLQKSKKLAKSTHTIAVMSGDFVQRGEPAIVNKWARAQMAVEQGVDLIIELPTIFACQSAEHFAAGSMRLLNSLSIVDNFCFGSEAGNLEDLMSIAKILVDNPIPFQNLIKNHLNTGVSYPVARSKALIEYSKKNKWTNILNNSNNILGIEYLKAKYKYNLDIEPFTIQRNGSDYNESNLNHSISSATAIRKKILDTNVASTKAYLPEATFKILCEFQNEFGNFNQLNNYSDILNYNILSNFDHLHKLPNFEIGLDHRLYKFALNMSPSTELIASTKTKRYTYTRLQRLLIHSLLQISNEKFKRLFKTGPQYIRPLAANTSGLKLLNEINKKSKLPIISKFSRFADETNQPYHESLMLDKLASDMFYLGLPASKSAKGNFDYYKSFFIKK